MGSGASVRPSPNAVTDTSVFFIANASHFAIRVVSAMQKDAPPEKPAAEEKGKDKTDGAGENKEKAKDGEAVNKTPEKKKSTKGDAVTIQMQEVKEFRGKFVEIFLVDKHDKQTPLGGQRPVEPCHSLIITEKKAVKPSACALSGVDDPNAWIGRGGENLFPCEFFVANASGSKLVVVARDRRRADIDSKVLKHKEVMSFRGETVRIFSATSEKEIHGGDVKVRTSLIVAADDRVLQSRQLIGEDITTEKWITTDGKYCCPK